MQLTARLTQRLDDVAGTTDKGSKWVRHQVIVTTEGQYPKQVLIEAYENGRNEPLGHAQLGDLLKIDLDIETKKYGTKYFTSVKAHKIELVGDPVGTAKAQPQRASVATHPPMPAHPKRQTQATVYDPQGFEGDDDLPF